jgi:hypothetical protein
VGLFSHESVDVSSYIVPSKSRQVPVGFNSGYIRVVGVEVAVRGSDEVLGDSSTKENSDDPVWIGFSFVLIKS